MTPLRVGDRVGAWVVIELREEGTSAARRRWLLACLCGYKATRFENEIRAKRMGFSCSGCASRLSKAKEKNSERAV